LQEAPVFDPTVKKKKPRKSVAFEEGDLETNGDVTTAQSHSISMYPLSVSFCSILVSAAAHFLGVELWRFGGASNLHSPIPYATCIANANRKLL
jgi:hypothetical protein